MSLASENAFCSLAQSRPFDLLVFPCWSIFSKCPKRLPCISRSFWASEFELYQILGFRQTPCDHVSASGATVSIRAWTCTGKQTNKQFLPWGAQLDHSGGKRKVLGLVCQSTEKEALFHETTWRLNMIWRPFKIFPQEPAQGGDLLLPPGGIGWGENLVVKDGSPIQVKAI